MTTKAAKRSKPQPRPQFRCGFETAASIERAAKDDNRKPANLMLTIIEDWLKLKGYKIDAA